MTSVIVAKVLRGRYGPPAPRPFRAAGTGMAEVAKAPHNAALVSRSDYLVLYLEVHTVGRV